MMRSSANFTRMAWLALAAAVLLSAMPTASRLLVADTSGAVPVLMEMCTTSGRQLVDVSPYIAAEERPAQLAEDHMAACAYCVLATPLPPLPSALSLPVVLPAGIVVVRRYLPFLQTPRNLRGLGSQAPPPAL